MCRGVSVRRKGNSANAFDADPSRVIDMVWPWPSEVGVVSSLQIVQQRFCIVDEYGFDVQLRTLRLYPRMLLWLEERGKHQWVSDTCRASSVA